MNHNATLRKLALPGGAPMESSNPWLRLLPPELAARPKDAFFLAVNFLPLAAGGTASVVTQITAEAAFLILGATRVVTDSPADTTSVAFFPALVTVSDGTNRQLMDRAVHIENLCGTAQLPAIWPWPKFVAAGSQVTTTVQNLDGATARNVRITYMGFKIF